jgi:hypothetical protein
MPQNLKRRGNVFWFRLRIPTDHVRFIHRHELARSLHTGDLRLAKRRMLIAAMAAHNLLEVAKGRPMEKAYADKLIEAFASAEIERLGELDFLAPHSKSVADIKSFYDRARPALNSVRWSPATGQFAKLGSPIQKDEPDGGTTEAVFSGF